MDFRIRPIKNNSEMNKEVDPLFGVLKELAQVMKETNHYLKEAKKQKQTTNQILLQLQSSFAQKYQSFKAVQLEVRKISQSTCQTLSKIVDKLSYNSGQSKSVTENKDTTNFQKVSQFNSKQTTGNENNVRKALTEEIRDLGKQIRQFTLSPMMPKDLQLKIEYKPKQIKNNQQRISNLKQYVSKMTTQIFSISFNMFFKDKIEFQKIKAYCCENILGNLISLIKEEKLSDEEVRLIDRHLSEEVLNYLQVNYPRSQQKQGSQELLHLISEKNIFNQPRFDLIGKSPVKYMSPGGQTEKEVMRLLNYIIALPDSKLNPNSETTLFTQFQKDMKNCFSIVFNKYAANLFHGDSKKRQLIFKAGDQKDSNCIIESSELTRILLENGQEPISIQDLKKFEENVKSYTKLKIGRKVSPHSKRYTDGEINSGQFRIKDSSIRRIIIKWIEALQQNFTFAAESSILRNTLLRLRQNSEDTNEGLQQKEALFQFYNSSNKQISKSVDQIRRNVYKIFRESIMKEENNPFNQQFCSPREAEIGNVAVIFSRASETYIIKYLKLLIDTLKQIQISYAQKFEETKQLSQDQKNPILVTMSLGDLMRCQISSKQKEIVMIYQYLLNICDRSPQIFEVVRIKNRFDTPNKDILINLWYYKTIMVEIQLAVKSESYSLQCSDKFCHFIYELTRDILGPISQLSSVWNKLSPKSLFFQKKYRKTLKKATFDIQIENRCNRQKHFYRLETENKKDSEKNLPYWCSNCNIFQSDSSKNIKCIYCKKRVCIMCLNTVKIKSLYESSLKPQQISRLRQGTIMRGIQIGTRAEKYYIYFELMGKNSIYSFEYGKIRQQISDIKKRFEQSSSDEENQSEISNFLNRNFIFMKVDNIQATKIISEIFIFFWEREFEKIKRSKVKTLSLFYSSTPSISLEQKKQVSQRLLKSLQIKKLSNQIETLNVKQNNFTNFGLVQQFKMVKFINCNSNNIQNLQSFPSFDCLEQLQIKNNNIKTLSLQSSLEKLRILQVSNNKLTNFQGFSIITSQGTLNIKENKLPTPNLEVLQAQNNCLDSLQGLPQLTALKSLNLTKNRIHSLAGMPVLRNLKTLDLSQNSLSSLQGMTQLQSLTNINISSNQLISFKGLPLSMNSAKQAYFQHNKLTSFQGFPLMEELERLFIYKNRIQTFKGLPKLNSLTILWIQDNKLSSFEYLPTLISLTSIILLNNEIQSLSGLENLPNIEEINLHSNYVSSLLNFPDLAKLKRLDLTHNCIKSLEGLPSLPSLTDLFLQRNYLSSVKELPSLVSLINLNLNGNSLTSIEGMTNFPCLQVLKIKNNKLKTLQGLPELDHLRQIEASSNLIENLSQIRSFKSLQILNLDSNRIITFKGMPQFPNLKQLDLIQNPLGSFYGMPRLATLENLDMSYNNLRNFDYLPELSGLKKMTLRNNHIEKFDNFPKLASLEQMNLESNLIVSFKGLPLIRKLKILNVNKNRIQSLNDFPKLSSLEQLFLEDNKLASVGFKSDLQSLTQLKLNNNQISNLSNFPNLMQLSKLELVNNKIVSLKGLAPNENIRHLNLCNNQLSSLDGLPSYQHLQILYLDHNKLKKGSIKALDSLNSLEILTIYHNQIESLDQIPQLKNLKKLSASQNSIKALQGIEKQASLLDLNLSKNSIHTLQGIEKLKKLSKLDLSENMVPLQEFTGSIVQNMPLLSTLIDSNGNHMNLKDVFKKKK